MISLKKITWEKISNEIRVIPKTIITFKNWWIYYLDVFGLMDSDNEVVYKLRNGMKFITRLNSFDVRMIKETYIYEPYSHAKINKGDVIVDIGAHIGTFSIQAGHKTGKTGTVFAYEPMPDTFDILQKNIVANSLQDVVIPHQLGISKNEGCRKFNIFKDDGKLCSQSCSFYQNQSDVIGANENETIIVECITLDSIFERNNLNWIDFLKIDCEGEEYDLIFNTSDIYLKKIGQMCIEYHDYLSRYNHQDLIDRLSILNFDVINEILNNSKVGCGIIYACNRD